MKHLKAVVWSALAASALFLAHLLGSVANLQRNREHVVPPTPTEVWAADVLDDLGVKSSWADRVFQRSVAYVVQRKFRQVQLRPPADEEEVRQTIDELERMLREAVEPGDN